MQPANVEAPVLPCRGCGAPLAVDPEAVDASCPACRAVTRVPDALRERARAYRRSLGVERGRVERARRSMSDSFAKLGKYFGPPLALVVIGHVVGTIVVDQRGYREYQDYETWAFGGAMGLLGLAFAIWLVFAVRAEMRGDDDPPPRKTAAPVAPAPPMFAGSVPGTCSTCGGQVSFTVEQASTRCPYCGATVFPTPAAQQALLAIVEERADLEVGRASRVHARNVAASFDEGVFETAMSSLRWLGLLVAPALLIGIGVFLVFQSGLPDLSAPDIVTVIGLILSGAGVLVLLVIAGFVLLIRRLSRIHTIRRTLLAVASEARAQVVMGVRPVFDWLDAHWAAEVPPEILSVARSDDGVPIRRFSLPMVFAGRSALLVVAHAPHVRRVDLFFAQHKRRAQGQGHGTQAAYEVRSTGMAVLVTNGGAHLIVRDSDPVVFAPPRTAWLLDRAARIADA
jgi:predicted RNA-binding Zn-ribbon protein involved in translation (DUF1610 family)